MTGLSRGVFAIARTKRKRFLWCAWWSGMPAEKPFRPPDAWGGGARTEDEARGLAERAAGMPLEPIDGRWAGAFKRLRAGRPPFPNRPSRPPRTDRGGDASDKKNPYVLLGVPPEASLEEVRAAFRANALVHHPDHGGEPEAFIALKRAYDTIVKRRTRNRATR